MLHYLWKAVKCAFLLVKASLTVRDAKNIEVEEIYGYKYTNNTINSTLTDYSGMRNVHAKLMPKPKDLCVDQEPEADMNKQECLF